MKINNKIEKELLFKNNIKDITSISLDSDYKVKDCNIEGNFIISGDYRIHELSLNREKFEFKIPFSINIDDDVDMNTIKVEIINFEYDYRKDELLVNIEYDVVGDREDVLIFDNEESLDEFLNKREIEVIDTRIEEINECIENEEKEENQNIGVEEAIKDSKLIRSDDIKLDVVDENLRKEEMNTNEILDNIDKQNDKFVTYKIYKIKENDTLESIVLKYKTTIDELSEFNELNNLQINDKLIIPYYE